MTPTEADLLAELASAWREEERREGEITVGDLMQTTGRNRAAVRDYLDSLVRAGRLSKRTTSAGRVYFSKV